MTPAEKKRRIALLKRAPKNSVGAQELAKLERSQAQVERERVKAIFEGRQCDDPQAAYLAFETDLTAQEAKEILRLG